MPVPLEERVGKGEEEGSQTGPRVEVWEDEGNKEEDEKDLE